MDQAKKMVFVSLKITSLGIIVSDVIASSLTK